MFYNLRFSLISREGHVSRQCRMHRSGLGKLPLILIYSENRSLCDWPLKKPALHSFLLVWNSPVPSVNSFQFVLGFLLGVLSQIAYTPLIIVISVCNSGSFSGLPGFKIAITFVSCHNLSNTLLFLTAEKKFVIQNILPFGPRKLG